MGQVIQKVRANAHKMRDAGCFGLSPVILTKIHSLNVRQSPKSLKIY